MKGLANLGSTCYINTTIQCLGNCSPFVKCFLKEEQLFGKKEEISTNERVLQQVQDIYIKLILKKSSLVPKGLISAIQRSEIGKFIQIRSPNDMHEFLSLFIDLFSENMQEYAKCVCGIQHMRMSCSICDYCSINKEKFTSIMLSFPDSHIHERKKKRWELINLINFAFQEETINERSCDNCQRIGQGQKRTVIRTFPQVLMIMIKRYDYNGNRIDNCIDVPYKIDLSYLSSHSKDYIRRRKIYKIKSIACHVGDLLDGHYYSIVLNEKRDKWYEINDDDVTELDTCPCSSEFYVLFYELI